ncbi:type II secretion system F family protein [Corynebacterium lubricantis]|uniref:type II secretion system F family protein n=1 Tax=Corynebacterium lubricantis TaxID=541095 RepID=UPI000382F327|nr:type II secretion system F family protein [Corynebacterium lubricantis]
MFGLLACAILVYPGGVAARVEQRRLKISSRAIISLAVIAFAVIAIVADRVMVIISGCLAALTVLYVISKGRQIKNEERIHSLVADYLGHLLADIRAGATLSHACAHALAEVPAGAPAIVRSDLSQLSNHVAHGGNGADILATSSVAELRNLGTMWALTESHGLPIATLLGNNRDRMDKATRHRRATAAALAGPKTTASVLAALPLAGIGMGMMMGANPVGFLTTTQLGGVLLLVGTGLTCAGIIASHVIMARAAS